MKKNLTGIICILLFLTLFIADGVSTYGIQKANTEVETQKFTTQDDINDKRIGVLLGSVHDTYVAKNYPEATVVQFKSPPDLIVALKAKKIDAALYTYETMVEILKNDDSIDFLGESLFDVRIGMGFNKKNIELRDAFNAFLKKIKSNGVYEDMVQRWMKGDSPKMPQIENSENNGTLIVGIVSDKGLPFTIVENGKMIGYDVEIAERFAAEMGKKIVFSDMEFGSLIAAVSTNKIDMISSTLMITPERQEKISFSDEYYKLGTAVIVLKENFSKYQMATHEVEDDISFIKGMGESFYNNIIAENRYILILNGLKLTIIIAILAALFGTILGMLVCFMRMSRHTILRGIGKLYIAILRGTPVLVLLMLIFYVVFASVNIDPIMVSIIAFGMNFAAYVSEMFRAAIVSIDKGQQEAGIAGGFTKVQTFLYIIMPQAIKQVLPVYKGETISLLKMTSIVGYIAVQDLTKASDIIRSRTFDAFFPLIMVAIIYFIISWLFTIFLDYIGMKIDPRSKPGVRAKSKLELKGKEASFGA